MDATQQHGWGNWKMVQQSIPSRNRNQVKSHAQKFAKVSLFVGVVLINYGGNVFVKI